MRFQETNRRRGRAVALAATALLVGAVGCQTSEPKKTKIVVPSAATSAPEYEGDGSIPEQRYVIRMSDGERDWEVQFPDVATGYEMHIPLDERKKGTGVDGMRWESENMTEADRELLEQLRRKRGDVERQGVYEGGENVLDQEEKRQGAGFGGEGTAESDEKSSESKEGPSRPGLETTDEDAEGSKKGEKKRKGKDESKASPYRPSYLLGMQEVKRLYKAGNYELAMVRLVKLEQAYGPDEKILSMKGTLWLKLGRPQLARKAWEQVLEINPNNQQVIEALKRLNKQSSE